MTITQEGKTFENTEMEIMYRISNCGTMLIPFGDYVPKLFIDFTVHCLSITHKTWVASDGMSTYIVKLKNNGEYLPR